MELPENMKTAWDHAEFKDLSRQGVWFVEDVFWMLFGENGYVSIKSVKASPLYSHDPRIFCLLQDTKIAILTGRFGEFDKSDVESRLPFFSAHPLRFIDWINEKRILDEAQGWGYSAHPLFVEIIESWEARRAEEEKAQHPLDYILDYQRTAKFHVWSLKRLRRLLFHQGYAWEYFSGRYHRYDPSMEEYMRVLDQDIIQGLAIGRITGPKGANGRGDHTYSALELLKELRSVGYPIPDKLIKAKESGDLATTEALLRQLHESMKVYVENGGRPVAPRDPAPSISPTEEPTPSSQSEEQTQPEPEVESSESILEQKLDNDCACITFRKNKTKWEVGIANIIVIDHTDGMLYINHLLRQPNKPIPCVDLAKLKNDQNNDSGIFEEDIRVKEIIEGPGSPQDQFYKGRDLDLENYMELKEEVLGLKNDLDKAEKQKNKTADIEVIRAEYKKQSKILNSLYDKKGNLRNDSNAESKARKNVCRAIQRTKDSITENLPEMREYLKHIKTGGEVIFSPPIELKFQIK